MRPASIGIVPPACENIHLMSRIARERAAEQQARHRARGVVRHLDHRRERADAEPAAAGGDQRMDVDHGLAAVQLLQHRLVDRIAQPLVAVVGLQVDAVGLEGVEGVFDLLQRHVDVHHRQRREDAEAARIIAPHLGGEVLADARRSCWRPLGAGVEPQARGGGERQHRGADAVLVHQLRSALAGVQSNTPGNGGILRLPSHSFCIVEIGRRIEMMVGVDQRLGAA